MICQKEYVSDQQCKLNQDETKNLASDTKYVNYKKWLKQNGVLMDPRIIYPAYFGPKGQVVVGVAISAAVPSNCTLIAVPYSMIMNMQKAQKQNCLKNIMDEYYSLFHTSQNKASQFHIMLLYLCYQLLKGQKSFYAPYFQICSAFTFNSWRHWDLLLIQNEQVMKLIKRQSEKLHIYSQAFIEIFQKHTQIFEPKQKVQQYTQIIDKAYTILCSRSFGWPLPCIYVIPMADSLNHSNSSYLTHMLINKKFQSNYFQHYSVKQNNYDLSLVSQHFPPKIQSKKHKKRAQKLLLKNSDLIKDKQMCMREQIHYIQWMKYRQGRKIQNIQFCESSCSEDNQSDEQIEQNYEQQIRRFKKQEQNALYSITQHNKVEYLTKYWRIVSQHHQLEQQPSQNQQDNQEVNQQAEKQNNNSQISDTSEEQEDESYPWVANAQNKQTYFVMATRNSLQKDSQLFNFYGRRSNKYLLAGYNFILPNNKYDSFCLQLNMDNWLEDPQCLLIQKPILTLIRSRKTKPGLITKKLKIKKQRVCIQLINHCRALLIGWNNIDNIGLHQNSIRITIPFCRLFQEKVLHMACEVIKCLLQQYMTSLQQDMKILSMQAKHATRTAIQFRIQYKIILQSQLKLLRNCIHYLDMLQNGRVKINSHKEMGVVKSIRQYLLSLQKSRI